jgi:hypothetical protein
MRLEFELDREIIHHIIYSQAGSIGKAIIELLMNAADAGATTVSLSLSPTGFTCADNGRGFATRKDVIQYFGKFGTPHVDGDAKYGRFRLGRGQIMAHAKTLWKSRKWQMEVDTRTMGYAYDLTGLSPALPGCTIEGEWYEPLEQTELMSTRQEIKDLVRYTSIEVVLNGVTITKNPACEKWDFEDEYAYYRAKENGAVSIYNQGVLVRNDPGNVWGAGGLIVSKKALALNVSRTEILRKTCPAWKHVAKVFAELADKVSSKNANRKTEERRERCARALLTLDPKSVEIAFKEEIITILPGKKHVSLREFDELTERINRMGGRNAFSIVESGNDIPLAESVARDQKLVIVHPQTLDRFGCHSTLDFLNVLTQVIQNIKTVAAQENSPYWFVSKLQTPKMIEFSVLRENFKQMTAAVSERILDAETRRAWIALRSCLAHYANLATGGWKHRGGTCVSGGKGYQILLGNSNCAEAWTDGSSYIAIDLNIVTQLRHSPMLIASKIFSLVDHEICHEGDSLMDGHDDEFKNRYHDLSIAMSMERQRYLQLWVVRYTASLEAEGRNARTRAWMSQRNLERAGNGRIKRGLSKMLEISEQEIGIPYAPEEKDLIDAVNRGLLQKNNGREQQSWNDLVKQSEVEQEKERKLVEEHRLWQEAENAEHEAAYEEHERHIHEIRRTIAGYIGIDVGEVSYPAWDYLDPTENEPDEARRIWQEQPWVADLEQMERDRIREREEEEQYNAQLEEFLHDFDPHEDERNAEIDPLIYVSHELRHLVRDGETNWALQRNATIAGFQDVDDYLKWRAESDLVSQKP